MINWRDTKFLQSAFVQITGAIALFAGKIDGTVYVALSTLALGIYGAAAVADKRLNGNGNYSSAQSRPGTS